jgi:hypothetical protein
LINEKNEIERGNRYMESAEADGYYEDWSKGTWYVAIVATWKSKRWFMDPH